MQTESRGMVAGKLTSHAQRLSSSRLADCVSDTKQLMLADRNEIEKAAQPGTAYSGDAPGTYKQVQGQPGLGTSKQPLQSVGLVAAKGEHNGQVSRNILERFATISGYIRTASNLVLCIRKNAHQSLLM